MHLITDIAAIVTVVGLGAVGWRSLIGLEMIESRLSHPTAAPRVPALRLVPALPDPPRSRRPVLAG